MGVHTSAPTFTSSSAFSAPENQTAVGTVAANGTAPIVYSITGGSDAALFAINSSSGVLTFLAAPDYETPGDVAGAEAGDNIYELTVTATNSIGATNQNVVVTVTDVAEAPIANPAAWYRFNNGITVTGSGISQWDDVSGNGHHLLQATDSRRPTKQTDGRILFNGTSHFLLTGAWVLAQPITIYALMKQVTWTGNDVLFGNGDTSTAAMRVLNLVGTPNIYAYAGTSYTDANTNLTLDTYKALAAVFNAASSLTHVDGSAAAVASGGTIGTNGMNKFCIAADAFPAFQANVEVKECLIYSAAHDSTQRQIVFDYLAAL